MSLPRGCSLCSAPAGSRTPTAIPRTWCLLSPQHPPWRQPAPALPGAGTGGDPRSGAPVPLEGGFRGGESMRGRIPNKTSLPGTSYSGLSTSSPTTSRFDSGVIQGPVGAEGWVTAFSPCRPVGGEAPPDRIPHFCESSGVYCPLQAETKALQHPPPAAGSRRSSTRCRRRTNSNPIIPLFRPRNPLSCPRRDVGWQSRAPASAPANKNSESLNLSIPFAAV